MIRYQSNRRRRPCGLNRRLQTEDFENDKVDAAVCQFAMLRHDSEYKGTTTIGSVLELLESLDLGDDPYKAEFAELVKSLA